MRKSSLLHFTLILSTLMIARGACAWNDVGHRLAAMIAWDNLTPETRAAVTDLLKHHARYEADLVGEPRPDIVPDQPDQLPLHVFAVAATWPDIVRKQSHPMHNLHHHPYWHYIDIPFEDGAKQPAPQPIDAPGPHNIVEALTHCVAELKDPAISPDAKAIDLCWVEHLVGDIHQPLHAVSRYSQQFPKGDQGGNMGLVLRDPPYPDSQANLHFVWDSMAGVFQSEFIVGYLHRGLRADPQFSREAMKTLLATTDFLAWANESHELAVRDAYLDGKLEVATNSRRGGGGPTTTPISGLPPGYKEKAERDSMQRIALAGYRLADLLNSIFAPKP